MSPRVVKEQYEILKPDAISEFVRVYRMRFVTAQEQLKKARS